MKRAALAIAIATIFAGSAALSQQATSADIAATNTDTQTDIVTQGGADTTNLSDEKFLKSFAQINAAEVKVGKLAVVKTDNPEVKAFAQQMVDDHLHAISLVQEIAGSAEVDVKAQPDFVHKAKSAMLDINVGGSFDRAYMKMTVEEHEKLVEMLQNEIRDGQDASVKALASQALLDVQKHLRMAQDLNATISNEQFSSASLLKNKSSVVANTATGR